MYSTIIGNWGETVFNPITPNRLKSMGTTISVSAGYFLQSYSHTLSALQLVENSSDGTLDYRKFRKDIRKALEEMNSTVEFYRNFKNYADATPYNETMIEILKSFDYIGFSESRGLNKVIFSDVKKFLSNGDVRGAFSKILSNCEKLSSMLESLLKSTESGIFPDLNTVWRTNNLFSDTMVFGQYCAEVFYTISN